MTPGAELYAGAYWSKRAAGEQQTAELIQRLVTALEPLGPSFSGWAVEQGVDLPHGRGLVSWVAAHEPTAPGTGRVLSMRSDGGLSSRSLSLRLLVGETQGPLGLGNTAVLEARTPDAAAAPSALGPAVVTLLGETCRADWAVLSDDEVDEAVDEVAVGPGVLAPGRTTWLSDERVARAGGPRQVGDVLRAARRTDHGWLVAAGTTVAEAVDLSRTLLEAGLLGPA